MIGFSSELYKSYQYAPQLSSLWDFYIEDWINNDLNISQLKVITTSLPEMSFTYETRNTGEKFYVGYEMPETFSVTFREDVNFSVYKYFKEWESQIFDKLTGQFISSHTDKTRNGALVFQTFKFNMESMDFDRYLGRRLENRVMNIKDSAFMKVKSELSKLGGGLPANIGKQFVQDKLTEGMVGSDLESTKSSLGNLFELQNTMEFGFHNIKYLGIGETTVDYDSQDELQITVNFAVDAVTYDGEVEKLKELQEERIQVKEKRKSLRFRI